MGEAIHELVRNRRGGRYRSDPTAGVVSGTSITSGPRAGPSLKCMSPTEPDAGVAVT